MHKTKQKKLRNSQKCVLCLFVRHFLHFPTKFCAQNVDEKNSESASDALALAPLSPSVHCLSIPMTQTLIRHLDHGERQSAVFVDAFTWLRWHFRLGRPFALSFTGPRNFSSDGIFTRLSFVRPLPFAQPNFQFAILSPFLSFNIFGMSSIGTEMTKVFLKKAICAESIELAPTVHVRLIDYCGQKVPFECALSAESKAEQIAHFFQNPKLLYEGDLFDVSADPRNSCIYKATFPSLAAAGDAPPPAQLVQRGLSSCIEDFPSFGVSSSPDNPFHGRYPQPPNLSSHHFVPYAIRELASKLSKILFPLFTVEKQCKINPLILFPANFEASKLTLERVCGRLDVRLTVIDCFDFLLNVKEGQEGGKKIEETVDDVQNCTPCICWVRNVEVLFPSEETAQRQGLRDTFIRSLLNASKCVPKHRWPSVFFVNISPLFNASDVPERLAKAFHWEFRIEEGDERMEADERAEFALWALRRKGMEEAQLVDKIVELTKGFSLLQLIKLFDEAESVAIADHHPHFESRSLHSLPRVGIGHFKLALKRCATSSFKKRDGHSEVGMEDIGGLDEAKQLLVEALDELVQEHSSSRKGAQHATRLRRQTGILLHGPPGCGKTMLAKAVATQTGLSFISVKGPELLSQFVGESEHNLRQVFAKAKRLAPSVLFFDELDSLVPARGGNSDSGGVMNRMVSQFLTELDSCHWSRNKAVFVMGATNRPDLLDPCLLSPGRFDKLVPIDPANDLETKERILSSLCRKIKLAGDFSVKEIAQKCPQTMSGAELAGLVTKASMNRLRELIEMAELEGKSDAQMAENADFALAERHFDMALSQMTIKHFKC